MSRILTPLLLSFCASGALAQGQDPLLCADVPTYALLDFWVGEWDVYSGDKQVGTNRIEKILDGCAILEHWSDPDGNEGESLFYVDQDGNWQQVWVTPWAANPGGVKEKSLVETLPDGSVRFQGEMRHPDAGAWLDRTTLTPLEDGGVRQLIEISRDEGDTWRAAFDAIYRPANSGTAPD